MHVCVILTKAERESDHKSVDHSLLLVIKIPSIPKVTNLCCFVAVEVVKTVSSLHFETVFLFCGANAGLQISSVVQNNIPYFFG